MATTQIPPAVVAQHGAGRDSTGSTGSTKQPHEGHSHPIRTAIRGTGIFLDTAWRIVLLGGEGLQDPPPTRRPRR
jgi:hypothetical protein